MDINELAKEIQTDKKNIKKITPRELFNALGFERRTSGNCYWVDKFLNDNSLMVEPHYNDVWIDSEIDLKHQPLATTNIPIDPIRKINILSSATNIPTYIDNSDSLNKATTLMQCHNFSQLPVTTNKERGLIGYISWESICKAQINGIKSEIVKDYVNTNVATLLPETPLIQAIEIVKEHDFAIVLAKDKSLFGIVTVSDITSQFIIETEPFLLINELECHLRNLLKEKILLTDLQTLCNANKTIKSIDDLSFGDYIAIFSNKEQWEKIGIVAEQDTFIDKIEEIRSIRNDVMHFRPTEIDAEKINTIRNIIKYLRYITNLHK